MTSGIATLLQGALSQGQPSSGQRPQTRTPMYFTSRLRSSVSRLPLSNALALNTALQSQNADFDISVQGPVLRNEAAAFFGTTAFMPVIGMAVNPSSVTFTQTKRWTKKDTRQGSVYFHFTNEQGQNNDVLTIQFKGNTGNIDLRGTVGNPDLSIDQNAQGFDNGALQKFLCFHNLYLLTREPMLLNDGTENTFTIGYQSGLFPEIIFNGFFSKVLEFDENGEKPNSRDYSFEFIVKSSFPSLDTVLAQILALAGTPSAPIAVPAPIKTQTISAGTVAAPVTPARSTELPSGVGTYGAATAFPSEIL